MSNIGSIPIPCRSDNNSTVLICDLVLQGLLQWAIGQNVAEYGNIYQIGEPMIVLGQNNENPVTLTLTKVDRLHNMPASCFRLNDLFNLHSGVAFSYAQVYPWSNIKKLIDHVHRHVCEHPEYGDIKALFERNKLWSLETEKYLKQSIARYRNCRSASLSQPSRKVSFNSPNRHFNNAVCLDHMFLGDHCILHIIDTKTRYSAGIISSDTSLANATYALQFG